MKVLAIAICASLVAAGQIFSASDVAAVRGRLMAAAKGTEELFTAGRESHDPNACSVTAIVAGRMSEEPARLFPTVGDVRRYSELRPWSEQYLLYLSGFCTSLARLASDWPRKEDADALRKLLADPDPRIRGLAAEALATLYDPVDVPRIALLLKDSAESVPILGWTTVSSVLILPNKLDGDPSQLFYYRSWRKCSVSEYAAMALKLMTGEFFATDGIVKPVRGAGEPVEFDKWWAANSNSRQSIWYWRQRLTREFIDAIVMPKNPLDALVAAGTSSHPPGSAEARIDAIRRQIGSELRELPLETELKVRLVALNKSRSFPGVDLDAPLMGPLESIRVKPQRLLEILERKDLWPDVDWGTSYGVVANEIMAPLREVFFTKGYRAPGCRDCAKHAAWHRGKSGLRDRNLTASPPAKLSFLDEPDTCDAVLRDGFAPEQGRGMTAARSRRR